MWDTGAGEDRGCQAAQPAADPLDRPASVGGVSTPPAAPNPAWKGWRCTPCALAGPNLETKRLRKALPDLLADAADRTGGFTQRRLGRSFAERVGPRYGESQVFLERGDEDTRLNFSGGGP